MKDVKFVGQKIISDTKFNKLLEREYMIKGHKKNYYISDMGNGVFIFPFTADGKVILEREFRPGPNKMVYGIPAGIADHGEKPIETAARELMEETGYKGELIFLGEEYRDGYIDGKHYFYIAKNVVKIDKQRLDASEVIEIKVVDIADLYKILESGEVANIAAVYIGLDYLRRENLI